MFQVKEIGLIVKEAEESSNLPNQIDYQYYRNLAKRKLIINNQLSADLLELVILPLLEMDNDGSDEDIEIILNTNGGSVYDSFSLCNVIDNLKTPTTITVITYAFSMGSIILMAGYNNPKVTKQCYPYSFGLIHPGTTFLEGNASSVKDTQKFQDKVEEMVKKYVNSHSKINSKFYDKIARDEFYMTANDMLKYGLVDKIIT